ncbi:hypothetical protein [Psychroflexus aestuariivivens]|uniref:hypothetical protein n=1 Tax=Psychroflexus aestuariivivens TaxID=1795040 RepID=UPI000FDB3FA4|nr:hypothetical protein [Psychroflexus aestuariivivens]
MKKLILFPLLLIIFQSCDDGDIIVSDFNFNEDTNLNLCQEDNTNILHYIDSETNEAISFTFQNEDFDGTFEGLMPPEPITININNNNRINYRLLSGEASSNEYFCQDIPPSSPLVVEEYVSTTGGTATIEIIIESQDDDDGIPAENEDRNGNGNYFDDDEDEDGIPDFLDIDDDNDNVLTATEINNEFGVELDTDEDNTPNYLDEDDDGDGVITRYEDLNAFDNNPDEPILNPADDTNEFGLPNYLNPDITESLVIDEFRENRITRTFRTQIVFNDITLKKVGSDQTITLSVLRMGFIQVNSNDEILEMDFE